MQSGERAVFSPHFFRCSIRPEDHFCMVDIDSVIHCDISIGKRPPSFVFLVLSYAS